MNTKRMTCRAFIKSVNEQTREVEQIVSVFENVDLGRDRVKTGAFAGSLTRWAASGDPIPAIWSHMWDDPFAHIGFVIEAKELLPGDPLLPDEISELGGLYTRYKVDEAPFADQVFTLLKSRRVREASFAYDVIREKKNPDGTTDLIELDVIEIGPTLKGMNPMTQLLARKAARSTFVDELVKAGVGSADQINAAFDAAEAKALETETADDEPDGKKAYVQLAGSLEATMESYFRAALEYAQSENMGDGGFYALHPEGTFPAEDRAVYCVEGWNDPWGEGAYFEFHFATDDAGDLAVDSYTEVTIEATAQPKARKTAMKALAKTEGFVVVNFQGDVARKVKSEPAAETDPSPVDEPKTKGVSPASVFVEAESLDIG